MHTPTAPITHAYQRRRPRHRRFSGDESFLRYPNVFTDAKDTATVVDEVIPLRQQASGERGKL